MSIKHLPPKSKEEIDAYIKGKNWRADIYNEINNRLKSKIHHINSKKSGEEILLELITLSVYCNEALSLYPIYQRYKKNWHNIGFTKKDFVVNNIRMNLFSKGKIGLFSHDENKVTYEFMHAIQLMVKRYGSNPGLYGYDTTLQNYAWGIGFNYYIEIYSLVIEEVNTELFLLFGGKGKPILPHV